MGRTGFVLSVAIIIQTVIFILSCVRDDEENIGHIGLYMHGSRQSCQSLSGSFSNKLAKMVNIWPSDQILDVALPYCIRSKYFWFHKVFVRRFL